LSLIPPDFLQTHPGGIKNGFVSIGTILMVSFPGTAYEAASSRDASTEKDMTSNTNVGGENLFIFIVAVQEPQN
jgi:hypothetical protein